MEYILLLACSAWMAVGGKVMNTETYEEMLHALRLRAVQYCPCERMEPEDDQRSPIHRVLGSTTYIMVSR
jgi:hypothetical protein